MTPHSCRVASFLRQLTPVLRREPRELHGMVTFEGKRRQPAETRLRPHQRLGNARVFWNKKNDTHRRANSEVDIDGSELQAQGTAASPNSILASLRGHSLCCEDLRMRNPESPW